MSLPSICYEKAFKILMSITIITILGITGIAWAQIMENSERSIDNEITLAERKQNIDLIPKIHENQIIICTALEVSCK